MKNINSKEISIVMVNLLEVINSLFNRIYRIGDFEKNGTLSDETLLNEVPDIIHSLEEENRLLEVFNNSDYKTAILTAIEMAGSDFFVPLFGLNTPDYKLYSLKRLKLRAEKMLENGDFEYGKIIINGFEVPEEDIKSIREANKNKLKFAGFTRNAFYYVFLSKLENEIKKSDSESERNTLIDCRNNTIFFESFYERELLKTKFDIRKVKIEKIEGLDEFQKLDLTELRNKTNKTAVSIASEAIEYLKSRDYLERLKSSKPLLKCYILYLRTALNLMNLKGIETFKRAMESEIKKIPSVFNYQDAINEMLELVNKVLKTRKEEVGLTFCG